MAHEQPGRNWKQVAQRQAALVRLAQQALEDVDLETCLDEAARVAARQLNAEYSMVLEYLADGVGTVVRAGVGWDEGVVGRTLLDADPGSLAAYTLASKEPVIIEDWRNEERFTMPSLLEEHGITNGISVTIQGGESPWGILSVHAEGRLTGADAHFVEAVADLLGAVLDRRQAESEPDLPQRPAADGTPATPDGQLQRAKEQAHEQLRESEPLCVR